METSKLELTILSLIEKEEGKKKCYDNQMFFHFKCSEPLGFGLHSHSNRKA